MQIDIERLQDIISKILPITIPIICIHTTFDLLSRIMGVTPLSLFEILGDLLSGIFAKKKDETDNNIESEKDIDPSTYAFGFFANDFKIPENIYQDGDSNA